jgi:hypothetical protein
MFYGRPLSIRQQTINAEHPTPNAECVRLKGGGTNQETRLQRMRSVQLVFFVRGEKVMFDADLAKLYGVSTKAHSRA